MPRKAAGLSAAPGSGIARVLLPAAAGGNGIARVFLPAAAGGILHFLGFVGFGLWPLALVSLAALFAALEAARARGARDAALAGFVFGFVAHAGGFFWLWRLVPVFLAGRTAIGAALWLAHGAWFALGWALCALAYRRLRARGWSVALAGGAPLLVMEWLYPALFPAQLGAALVDRSHWIQIADLGGPLLLTASLVLVNAAALAAWEILGRGRDAAAGPGACLAAGLALALTYAYSEVRSPMVAVQGARAPALRVGVVQGNLGVREKREDPALVHRLYLEQTRELVAGAHPLDLVVWPETVYSRGLRRPLPLAADPIRDDLRVPLLFGAVSVETRDGVAQRFNSALLAGADGAIREAYDKNLLVPFSERVPLATLEPLFPSVQRFAPGHGVAPLALGAARIATPICSETAQPAYVRRMVDEGGANLIVSLANDAWFGDSQEPWIHLALARLRAVEERRFVVHATNSGVSAVIDPLGRVVARAGLLTRESLAAEVRLLEEHTLYARTGDWPGWIASAALVAGLALPRRRAATERSEGAQTTR